MYMKALVPIIVIAFGAVCANAAFHTEEISEDEYKKHGFKVTFEKDADPKLAWAIVSAPKSKWNTVKLASFSIRLVDRGKILAAAEISHKELDAGRMTGRILIRKDLRKESQIHITYGVEGGAIYVLNLSKK